MRPSRLHLGMNARAVLSIVVGSLVLLAAHHGFRSAFPDGHPLVLAGFALGASFPVIFFVIRKVVNRGVRDTIIAVSDGLLSLTERDYGLRLVALRSDELGDLVHRFNRLAERLRREHNDVYQREILLETVLGASSIAVMICNEARRIVYANAAARELFCAPRRLEGEDVDALLAQAPDDIREALGAPGDVIFGCRGQGEDAEQETFHLSKRYFELSTQRHTVYLLRPLTRELGRKEADMWKKAIRVISHEVNNSLAPITSLVDSARLLVQKPEFSHRLGGALDTIEERARHLQSFLDGYASFARLPMPRLRSVSWREILAGVEGLYCFRIEGEIPERPAVIDPAQMQQVLINLLKNAAESGSPSDQIALSFEQTTGPAAAVELQVLDRGRGMPPDVMQNAMLPFYSTKKSGTGLGLALCREIVDAHGGRLSLHPREGGGVRVRIWLPAQAEQLAAASG